jgi:pimeloyl-ACP methyl ester carboxylesterase
MEQAWKSGFFRSGPLLLEYKMQQRAGKPWALFLHGFGQDYRCFQALYPPLSADFSFLALHLPFHGESRLEGNTPITKREWCSLLNQLFQELKIEQVQAFGFSMGAKFLLSAAELKPELFSSITLLAPDGISMNPWYRFATTTAAGRFILHLGLFLFPFFKGLIILLTRLKIIRPALSRFALSELHSPAGRERVLNVWLSFRKLWPEVQVWTKVCRSLGIPVLIVLGRYDGILPLHRYQNLKKESPWIHWQLLECGHSRLIDLYAEGLSPDSANN